MRKAIFHITIVISILLVGCQQAGRGEFAAPATSFLPEATPLEQLPVQTPKPPRLTPTPSPIPMAPSPPPTPRPILTEKEIEALRRCLNNGIYDHVINQGFESRLEFEKYDKQQIVVRLYDYFDPPSYWGYMIFSISGDYFSFGIDRDYLNGPVRKSFGTLGEKDVLDMEQEECDGEFTFDFDPNPEYDFESQYFDRWPEIREKIIDLETERWTKYGRDEYWLRFFLYTEEYAKNPGQARVYFIIESTETPFIDVLKANVYEDGSVSYGWAVDTTDAKLEHYRKQVFDEVKIEIP